MRVNSTCSEPCSSTYGDSPAPASSVDSASRSAYSGEFISSKSMVVVRRTPPPLAGATILKPPCSLSAAMANFVSTSSGAKRSKYLCFCRLARPRTSLA